MTIASIREYAKERCDHHCVGCQRMAGLAAKGQAIYRLVYTDARAPEEVATLLGCNVQVVYNWQHKIRALARVFLAEGG